MLQIPRKCQKCTCAGTKLNIFLYIHKEGGENYVGKTNSANGLVGMSSSVLF